MERHALRPKDVLDLAAPSSWAASVMPCVLAIALSYKAQGFLRPLEALCLFIGAILMQSAVNALNDYADFLKCCMDVSYQFLHRTASACNKAGAGTDSTPVLVYQLFFDAKDGEHIAKLQAFKADLRRWAAMLKLQNMKFLIVSVPVVNMTEVKRRFSGWHNEIFDAMRNQSIYEFDFNGIALETVVDDKDAGNA